MSFYTISEKIHSVIFKESKEASKIVAKEIADLIKQKQPTLWQEYFKTSSKVIVENMIKQEKIFTLNEYFYGTSRLYLCAPLHPNACMHPVYKLSLIHI